MAESVVADRAAKTSKDGLDYGHGFSFRVEREVFGFIVRGYIDGCQCKRKIFFLVFVEFWVVVGR